MDRVATIELVYDRDCPNVEQARQAIAAALRQAGAPELWKEWDRAADSTPEVIRHYGSPTVLVDRRDVSGDTDGSIPASANSCRVYRDDCGCLCGTPTVKQIVAALTMAKPA